MLNYGKLPFEPEVAVTFRPRGKPVQSVSYFCSDELRLALDAALVTRRPLLLSGEPGTGKSSFAQWVAANLGWRFYKHVVTSSARPQDLLYKWDAVRRLGDVYTKRLLPRGGETACEQDAPLYKYVEPGPLWWAMDPKNAANRGSSENLEFRAEDPKEYWPRPQNMKDEVPADGAVLLIDEIDKADVDFPNDLLDPLDLYQFPIPELNGLIVRLPRDDLKEDMPKLLVVITTNRERDLPPAFIRRCVTLELGMPDKATLVDIARQRFKADKTKLYEAVADVVMKLRAELGKDSPRRPATAEYIDAVRACKVLHIRPLAGTPDQTEAWEFLEKLMLKKAAASGPQ